MNKSNSNISIFNCSDKKNSSKYLKMLLEKTSKKFLIWKKSWNNEEGCYNYFATLKNGGDEPDVELALYNVFQLIEKNGRQKGSYCLALDASYYLKKQSYVKMFNEKDYYGELNDLYDEIENNIYYQKINPYYNRTDCSAKIKNKRGIKAEKMLENVKFEYNCEILGEIQL